MMAAITTTPTTTPTTMPVTFVPPDLDLLVVVAEVCDACAAADSVTMTVLPGATLVTTDG